MLAETRRAKPSTSTHSSQVRLTCSGGARPRQSRKRVAAARHAVSKERAPKVRKARHPLANPAPPPFFPNPASPRPPVSRTAVRFDSRPPQSRPECPVTCPRIRKRLILNQKIKAHTASNPYP